MLPVFYCSQRWVRQDGQEQSCSLERAAPDPTFRSETKAWAHRTEKYCRFALLTSASKRVSPSIPALGLEHPHPRPPPKQTIPGCPAGVPGFFEMLAVLWPHGWRTPLHKVPSSPNLPNTFLCEHMEPELLMTLGPWKQRKMKRLYKGFI